MEEVSGPVIAIACVLSAVFIPTIFIPGITGRLYQQFAVTIAISVLISAFNALTLSPALAAMILKPKKPTRGPLGKFYTWFNRVFGRATDGYVNWSGIAIRKLAMSLLFLAIIAGVTGFLGMKLPGGFLPEEDQGYIFAGLQLPDASSLQRTDAATREAEKIIMNTPGVKYCTAIAGFNMLSGITNTYSSFFFITLKPWEERKTIKERYKYIMYNLNRGLMGLPRGRPLPSSSRHPGHRHVWWCHHAARGPFGKGSCLPLGKYPEVHG